MAHTNSGGRPVFYCYGPQRRCVITDLLNMGMSAPDVRGVDPDAMQMMGIEGGCFVNITTHPEQPTERIHEIRRVMGFILLTLDDSDLRGRMQRAYGGRRHDGHGGSL